LVQSFGHPEPEPFGVTRARARERAARLSAVTCEVYLRIPRDRRDGIDASTTVAFTLMDTQGPVVFDFRQPSDRLLRSIVNGRQARLVVEQGHIIVPALLLYAGRNIVQFDVVAGDDALNRGEDSLY